MKVVHIFQTLEPTNAPVWSLYLKALLGINANTSRAEAIGKLANALKRKREFVEANDLSTVNKYMAPLDLPLLPTEVDEVSYLTPKTGGPPKRKVKRPWRRSSLPST